MARGSIATRTNKDGSRSYVVRWDERGADGKRRQRERALPRKKEAEDFRIKVQHDLRVGTYVAPSDRRLGAWLDEWLTGRVGIRPGTRRAYEYAIRRWAPLADTPLADLTARLIEREQQRLLTSGLAGRTVAVSLMVLRRALHDAVRDRLLAVNPADEVERPPVTTRFEARPWTRLEATSFLTATDGERDGLLWRTMLLLMLRPGEAAALRWADLDETAATLTVRRTLATNADGTSGEGEPKGGRVRVLPLDPDLLARLLTEGGAQRDRLGGRWSTETRIFDRGDGGTLHRNEVARRLRVACAAKGVRAIRAHDLRHTGATLLAEAGVNPRDLQQLLGHANVQMTLNLYVHPTAGSRREAAATLAGLFV